MPSLEALLVNRGFSVSAVLADFPIEMYLMNEHSNYWADKSKGKQAHLCRIKIDNFLVERGVDKYIEYMSAAAVCGFGRSVIAFASLKNNI